MPVSGFKHEAWPRCVSGAGSHSVPVRAGPDELVSVFAIDFRQRRVDRSRETRVVELDREVVAVLFGALLPGGAQFNGARKDAELRALVRGVLDAGDTGLDVEGEGAD
ncbi:hypothetical protein BLJAPNOD_05414 [Ensifer sp. M14]|uniref:Uncharacterized protein n=1 Tax=Sinorhizobium sp. M14 TaxID=430451 RepID=A0A142BPX5_9HYPH|nr:hypothetical protein pSinB_274 [Sinorhizobium sp. M14]RDL47692.1 hypothetical protein BLJAPNOD_05414 [Ensifer sp. M14]